MYPKIIDAPSQVASVLPLVFPKIVPQNGWFMMETLLKMDDLEENPLFSETSIYIPAGIVNILPCFSKLQVTYHIGLQGIVMFHQPQEMHSFWPSAALATSTNGSGKT